MTIPINQSQIAHTTAEWQSLNPILGLDAIGIEVMTNGYNRYKRGDGVTRWNSLAYIDKVYNADIAVDAVPTDGSNNAVSSDGVYNALAGKQDKITNTANRLFYGSGTSGTLSQLALPSTAGSVLRQDTSGAPYWHQTRTVLYNTSGTNSNFTLSYTAADYNMIRIYFTYDNLVACSSVDVYSPNGKTASLSFVSGDANNLYYKFATVTISSTSVTWGPNGHAWAPNGGAVGIDATSKPIKILRVEGFKY